MGGVLAEIINPKNMRPTNNSFICFFLAKLNTENGLSSK